MKRKRPKIKVYRKGGYIQRVVNPSGKGKVVLVQTIARPGWTIRSVGKKRETTIGSGRTEKSAILKALKKGKKEIVFRD